jgi:hypothetical protein
VGSKGMLTILGGGSGQRWVACGSLAQTWGWIRRTFCIFKCPALIISWCARGEEWGVHRHPVSGSCPHLPGGEGRHLLARGRPFTLPLGAPLPVVPCTLILEGGAGWPAGQGGGPHGVAVVGWAGPPAPSP